MCMSEFLHVYMYTKCTPVPEEGKGGVQSPGTGVIGHCEPPWEC